MVGRSFDLVEWIRTLSSKPNGLADQTSQRLGSSGDGGRQWQEDGLEERRTPAESSPALANHKTLIYRMLMAACEADGQRPAHPT